MPSAEFSPDRLPRLRTALERHVERGDMPGLVALVHRRGETHVEAIGKLAFGATEPMRRDTIFRIASLSKPVVAVAALGLVEECVLRLDDPVDGFLPELANRRVLRSLDAAIDDTVPAARPITLRDVLTFRLGIGVVLAPPGRYPIQKAMAEAGFVPGPDAPQLDPDEWMRRLGTLPLVHQPGEGWLYHFGSDVLGVLIARATGKSLEAVLRERIFEPLGMRDTAFHVPAEKQGRFPPSYARNPASGAIELHDDPRRGRWSRPRLFQSGGAGLVSTADDYLAFLRMLLGRGALGAARILSRPTVELMTTDQLTPAQRAQAAPILDGRGWGLGLAVVTRRDDVSAVPGRFGWDGGSGTSAWADPANDLVGVLLTQRMLDSPEPPTVFRDFWTSAYQAVE